MSRLKVPCAIFVLGRLHFSIAGGFAEPIRIAMPAKSLTFLNYCLADRFGLFKYQGLEASFPIGRADGEAHRRRHRRNGIYRRGGHGAARPPA